MPTFILPLFFLLHLSIPTTAFPSSYHPTDAFFIDCGSSSKTTDDGRIWIGDGDGKLNFLPPNMANISSEATPLERDPSVYQIRPYMTARIFHHDFIYTFGVSPGPKFLRLYFYPTTYSGGFNRTQSFFSVTANGYILLNNFSAFLTVSAQKHYPEVVLVKEFIINVEDNIQLLNVTFSPSINSYSFVNGIEIVSMPDDLYFGENHPFKYVSTGSSMSNSDTSNTALETMYRLNIGGGYVTGIHDIGMFRVWAQDANFILGAKGATGATNITLNYTSTKPAYSAPKIIYETARDMPLTKFTPLYNLTWIFQVDSGFHYMFRLHFCDFISDAYNQRVFTIFIGNETAEPEFDIIYKSGGKGIPIVKDYVVWFPSPLGRQSKQDLWFAMTPFFLTRPEYSDATLNGLEIFKLNNSGGNLAGLNPNLEETPDDPTMKPSETKKKKTSQTTIYAVPGATMVMLLIVVLLILWQRKWKRDTIKSTNLKMTNSGGLSLPSDLCRHFSLKDLKFATADFDKNFVIGKGGFGNVYKGYIDNGAMMVAIKRLNPSSNQGLHEFRTEIEMLSKLRHLHLVSLIGYCNEHGEMILVYDYMANGTLRDQLYKTKYPHLSWKQRLQICIGAAKGLNYLHTGAEHNIIHRDVKSSNILLDEKWVAKVSDFGLSKVGPTSGIGSDSHVSTLVKGSIGYVDPEYYKRQKLTNKSDVYSFGVVLFEVLCARPAIVSTLPTEKVSLAEWARHSNINGNLEEIIDSNIKGQIVQDCLGNYVEIALSCLKDRGIERPSMNDVVWRLEFALQLQETAETSAHLKNPQISACFSGEEATSIDDEAAFSGSISIATTTS